MEKGCLAARVHRVQRKRLTALRAEGCGRLTAAGCVGELWKKVLKIDWPFRARGFLGLTAFQAEGCGIALSGDEYKVSVTGFTFSAIWHDRHSADWLAALASPIRLRRTSPAVRSVNRKEGPFMGRLRAYFDRLAHPMQDVHRGRIKHRETLSS